MWEWIMVIMEVTMIRRRFLSMVVDDDVRQLKF